MKKDLKSKVAAKNGCDGWANSKKFNNDNSAEFVSPLHVSLRFGTKFTLLNFLLLAYPLQPFLAVTFGLTHFFTAGLFLD